MILADTSLWVEHLRAGHAAMRERLSEGEVLGHPLVIGEIACGHLKNRSEVLGLLENLPQAAEATHAEARALIEAERLMGTGIGIIDAHLLASARLSKARLWTLDRRLASVAQRLGVVYTAAPAKAGV